MLHICMRQLRECRRHAAADFYLRRCLREMKGENMAAVKRLFTALLYGAVGILTGIVLVFSLLTVMVFRQYEQNDLFDVVQDHTGWLLISMAAVLLIFGLVVRSLDRRTGAGAEECVRQPGRSEDTIYGRAVFPWPMVLVSGGFSLFLVLVIRGMATNDALQLDVIMQEFSRGNYDSLQMGGYLYVYPFQVSYVMIGQLIAGVCGDSNYLVYQLLNVISIVCNLYCLYQITWELFHDRRICAVMQMLSMGCWFYYVFATFIYSDLWSFAFQTAALLWEIRYLREHRIYQMAGAGVWIAVASLLKTNCYVALIAMICLLLWDGLQSRKWIGWGRLAAMILMLFVMTFGLQKAVNAAVARTAGLSSMPSGTPAITYIAMGMQETEGKCGWYNGTNVALYRESGFEQEAAEEAAKASIRESIGEFQNSGRYLVKFYLKKFLSQWGDPTCVSMREMEETDRHAESVSALAESLIFGTGSRILQWGMNVMHSVIYLGVFVYLWVRAGHSLRKRKRQEIQSGEILIVLFLFGGMMFHQLWEASGRYVMRYYLTMLPLSAWGITWLLQKAGGRWHNRQT